jgi:thymidylate kinase
MSRPITLCIEGSIGAGKSTVLNALRGVAVVPEDVVAWRELLEGFYSHPEKWILALQCAVLYHFSRPRELRGPVVWERSAVASNHVFARLAHRNGVFRDEEYAMYLKLYDTHAPPAPDACIYLRTTPEVALTRVRARGDAAVTEAYAVQVHQAYEGLAQSQPFGALYTVDADRPMAEVIAAVQKIVSAIIGPHD